MPRRVVFDSGPLVALFDRDDAFHQQAVKFIRRFKNEPVSNLAVVTEVMYLLDFSIQAQVNFLHWIREGAVTLLQPEGEELGRVIDLMEKYADLPMDFTDATLVALAERLGIREIATVDRHFSIYRYRNRDAFRNVFK